MTDPLWSDERIVQEVGLRCHYKSEKDAWGFAAMRMRDEYEIALKTKDVLIQDLRERIEHLEIEQGCT